MLVACEDVRSPGAREIIDRLEKKGMVVFESTLFSRPEQAYINYLLNKAQFSNGLDLPNKYAHMQPFVRDEDHYINYLILLRLLVIVVIKINDDFCIYEELRKAHGDGEATY